MLFLHVAFLFANLYNVAVHTGLARMPPVTTASQVPSSYALGLDVGHSAVKISTCFMRDTIKTAVCHEIQITDEAEARRAAEETYEVPGGRGRYFVGDTALVQGVNAGDIGLSDSWIETPEYAALMLSGFHRARRAAGGLDPRLVVMGLPASLFARQKTTLSGLASELFPESRILVMPQSYAPYAGIKLNSHGVPDPAYAGMTSFAVVEVGYYTTDFAMIINERPVERANQSCSGVRVAVDALQRALSGEGVTTDASECEAALSSGVIKHFGQQRQIGGLIKSASAQLVTEVMDAANRLFETHARRMDAVVLAGGGARLLEAGLRNKWPNLIVPEHPRYAVAEGLRRIGDAKLLRRTV